MDKINRPRGLIRFASLNSIQNSIRSGSYGKVKWRFTTRAVGYSALLTVLVTVLTILLANRTDFSVTVLRTAGLLYQEQANNMVSNLYDLNLVNKTFNEIPVTLKLENSEGELKLVGNQIVMEPQGNVDAKFLVLLPKDELAKMSTPIDIGIYSGDKLIKIVTTSFLAPKKKKEEADEKD